jgi:hypothetical protein
MSYTHLQDGWIKRDSDGAQIPPDESNSEYTEYLAWAEAGGVTNPYIPPVPVSVTARQFNVALIRSGLYDSVIAAVSAAGRETQVTFEKSNEFERANPMLNSLAAVIGKTPSDIDNLFRLAATIS